MEGEIGKKRKISSEKALKVRQEGNPLRPVEKGYWIEHQHQNERNCPS